MKAQFGPDALVGIVLVAALGLGGVFFLHTFINGLNMDSFISILDTELDQKCFYTLLPMIGGDYVRSGENVTGDNHFNITQDFFGGDKVYKDVSYKFSEKVTSYSRSMENKPLLGKISFARGYLASKEVANNLRIQLKAYAKSNHLSYKQTCYIPVYGPGGTLGTAELYTFEKDSSCGKEGWSCCTGGYCDSGLTCDTSVYGPPGICVR